MVKRFAIIILCLLIAGCSSISDVSSETSVPSNSLAESADEESNVFDDTAIPPHEAIELDWEQKYTTSDLEYIGTVILPPLASVAEQQYKYAYHNGEHINKDGSVTFLWANNLVTLSSEGKVLSRLDMSDKVVKYDLNYMTFSDKYILLPNNGCAPDPGKDNKPGVIYFTDDGGMYLANVTLLDRQGNIIKEYPESGLYEWNNGEKEYFLPVPDGLNIVGYEGLFKDNVFWIEDDIAVINCDSRVILYDFAKDEGQIADIMTDLDEYWFEGVEFYGVIGRNVSTVGVIDNKFYYIAQREEQDLNHTVWCVDKDGAHMLFDGEKFDSLYISGNSLVLIKNIFTRYIDAYDVKVYWADPDDLALHEIGLFPYCFINFSPDRIDFITYEILEIGTADGCVLHSIDPVTGKHSQHPVDSVDDIVFLGTYVQDGALVFYYNVGKPYTKYLYDSAADVTIEYNNSNYHTLPYANPFVDPIW